MGVKTNLNPDEIRRQLEREVRLHEARIVTMLNYIGQTVVNEIRTSHISNWEDRTGNLRSSIGYMILVDGVPKKQSSFERVYGPDADKADKDGPAEGKNYLQSLVSLFPKGFALVIVAGMEYASYVEKMQNKTVLAQGEIEARKLVNQMISALNAKLQSKG